ncbi:9573_t:CDS:2 [Funneliformis mosseae]|uniref:9573_t:CDS:1 n=1 Tax=Funneliformis mosseae TaxID=27381 RepID=A0A9N9B725_FUNMO|nr:9573_t:CDS:2 [Funneliformis mosseae]
MGTSRTTRSASQGTSATRSISQNTNDIHWKSLSPKTRQHIHDLILSSVPIDEKLETLQVPKTSKNSNFDYTKLHSQNRALELTLAQELEQISQMEMQLEHEKLQSLAIFRSDKKAVDSRNKMLQRNKLHPLLKEEVEDLVEIDEELIKFHFKPSLRDKSSCLYDPEKDDQLCEIEKSLSLHLRSIEKNTQTIDDLVNEIDEAENSLLQLMKNAGLDDKLVEKVCL